MRAVARRRMATKNPRTPMPASRRTGTGLPGPDPSSPTGVIDVGGGVTTGAWVGAGGAVGAAVGDGAAAARTIARQFV